SPFGRTAHRIEGRGGARGTAGKASQASGRDRGPRSDRRLRNGGRREPVGGRPAGRRRQSRPGSRVRQSARQAGQDRPDRRRRDRPFHRGDQAQRSSAARRGDPPVERPRRAAQPDPGDDRGGDAAEEASAQSPHVGEHRALARRLAEGALRPRRANPRGDPNLAVVAREGPPHGELPGVGPAIAGRAPWTRQSGQWKGKSFIGGGRAGVRSALFMGALVAVQHNRTLKAFSERLIAAGKEKMVALIAVARKLLTILNAMLRDGEPWTEQEAYA